MLWTKRANSCIIFQTFDSSNESSRNSSCHFWNQKIRVHSNFTSLFNAMKDNSFVFFSSNLMYFRQKQPIEVNFLDFWVVGWKFTKFFILYLKLQVSFSLSFASLFSVKRDNSSVFFLFKFYIILTKGAHQSAKFQTFDFTSFVPW